MRRELRIYYDEATGNWIAKYCIVRGDGETLSVESMGCDPRWQQAINNALLDHLARNPTPSDDKGAF